MTPKKIHIVHTRDQETQTPLDIENPVTTLHRRYLTAEEETFLPNSGLSELDRVTMLYKEYNYEMSHFPQYKKLNEALQPTYYQWLDTPEGKNYIEEANKAYKGGTLQKLQRDSQLSGLSVESNFSDITLTSEGSGDTPTHSASVPTSRMPSREVSKTSLLTRSKSMGVLPEIYSQTPELPPRNPLYPQIAESPKMEDREKAISIGSRSITPGEISIQSSSASASGMEDSPVVSAGSSRKSSVEVEQDQQDHFSRVVPRKKKGLRQKVRNKLVAMRSRTPSDTGASPRLRRKGGIKSASLESRVSDLSLADIAPPVSPRPESTFTTHPDPIYDEVLPDPTQTSKRDFVHYEKVTTSPLASAATAASAVPEDMPKNEPSSTRRPSTTSETKYIDADEVNKWKVGLKEIEDIKDITENDHV